MTLRQSKSKVTRDNKVTHSRHASHVVGQSVGRKSDSNLQTSKVCFLFFCNVFICLICVHNQSIMLYDRSYILFYIINNAMEEFLNK